MQIELDPGLGVADVDRQKLSDIVTNLMVNAIKFTPDGGTVRLVAGPDGPDWIEVRVVDQGLGIEPAERRHLFEPFFTGFDTMHHSSGEYQFCKKGMGLGLCLVKMFVEIHGGTVDYAADPKGGSTFAFTLPRRSRRNGTRSGSSSAIPEESVSKRSPVPPGGAARPESGVLSRARSLRLRRLPASLSRNEHRTPATRRHLETYS